MMRRLLPLIIVMALVAPAIALAAENFPPPEFSFDYRFQEVRLLSPRGDLFEWIDAGVLLATLALAAWLVLRVRRRLYIFMLVIFALLYFGFYREGCVCSIGAIQNVALALGASEYVLPVTVGLFFLLPLIFALVFGRVFCAAVCPLGAVQEIVLLKPLRVPEWLERPLGLIPFVYLGVAALFAWADTSFLICRYDPYVAFFLSLIHI